ncbi:DNA-3-methyladenine glycosylase family protein [Candidatus Harpocratesius sp.]
MIPILLKLHERYDLRQTLECGQIFRFQKHKNEERIYYIPLKDRILKIFQKNDHILEITSNKNQDLKLILSTFFRLHDNYQQIQQEISIDSIMRKILIPTNGLHLLKQDVFECTISFLLSQCSNIPRITRNVNNLAEKFGTPINFDNQQFYLFPTREQLLEVSEKQFSEMGFGYRAKYIYNFVQNTPNFIKKAIKLEDSSGNHSEILNGIELNQALQNIQGVGQKIADCVQLFGFGDLSYFPVDTWMRKFMIQHYFNGKKASIKEIRQKGQDLFGKWAGYAQEFIYHYARSYENLNNSKS